MSQSTWAELSDGDPIRQGDIIFHSSADKQKQWKFILTADCDIAQNKAGQRYTYLDIVTAHHWLEHHWSPEQLRRVLERQMRVALEPLNARIRRENSSLSPLTSEKLRQWLSEESEERVMGAIYGTDAVDPKVKKVLGALRVALAPSAESPLETLKRVHRALERPVEELQTTIRDAFSGGGFPDFFFLPELPGYDSKGFIILLRDIGSLPFEDVHLSQQHAKLADNPNAPHRIGRLSDRLKFSISQKLAFLFSRIGLHPEFETACEETAEVLAMELGLSGEK